MLTQSYRAVRRAALFLILASVALAGCGSGQDAPTPAQMASADVGGGRLRVVATTTLVADVVANVGGEHIDLTTLLPIGADPHSYTPTPQDLRAVANAQAIFVNGMGLEAFLDEMLVNAGGNPVIVSVSEGIEPLEWAEPDDHADDHADDHTREEQTAQATDPDHGPDHDPDHEHGTGDPHVWFSVENVQVWTQNIHRALSALDPAHEDDYAQAAAAYSSQLDQLAQDLVEMVATLEPTQRKLVSDHRVFSYLARDYGFETIGAVVNSFSTLAQPSAQELAALQDQVAAVQVKAIFVSTAVNTNLSEQLAGDLGIAIVPVYTGSLSPKDGPAATYLDFMRYNVGTIVAALSR